MGKYTEKLSSILSLTEASPLKVPDCSNQTGGLPSEILQVPACMNFNAGTNPENLNEQETGINSEYLQVPACMNQT